MGGAVPKPQVGLAGQRPWPVARRTPSAHPQQRTMRASSVRTPAPAGLPTQCKSTRRWSQAALRVDKCSQIHPTVVTGGPVCGAE